MKNVGSRAYGAALNRIYDLSVFDWDGTAVPDRAAPRSELVAVLKDVLMEGAICVVITGTRIENVVDETIRSLPPRAKQGLYFCTDRDSEVFSFDEAGELVAVSSRRATNVENLALDRAAERLKEYVEGHGIEAKIVSDRINRRKIDLIPTARWVDPKKAEFGDLFRDVRSRLESACIEEGFAGLMSKTGQFSQDAGLPFVKITSDIKHSEIGLTGKSDSIHWISEHIARPQRIPHKTIVLVGDEYGSIGEISGGDSCDRTPSDRA